VNPGNQPGTVDELTELYRETIVRHAVHPVGFGVQINATHRGEMFNALCGDRIEVLLEIPDDIIESAAFNGESCAICTASASLLCEQQSGRPLSDLIKAHAWLQAALGDDGAGREIEALLPLLGVRAYPSRVKCALLPWDAALKALNRGEGAAPTTS
jgi:nitrogen fixation NifU-like protein